MNEASMHETYTAAQMRHSCARKKRRAVRNRFVRATSGLQIDSF